MTKYCVITVLFISLLFYSLAGARKKSEPGETKTGWKKVVWVDEKGVRHVTMVSPRRGHRKATAKPKKAPHKSAPAVIHSKVSKILDMESIQLKDGRVVRYIGIKAPPKDNRAHKKAMAFHRKTVKGKWVNILPGVEPYDNDGSLWGFVFVNRMTFVNAELIKNGYAMSEPVEPNTEYRILFERLENRAQKRKLGIWK